MKPLPTAVRGGVYYRVVSPNWLDPTDTIYSRRRGGRWNPYLEFGALYLNATLQVAAANARAQHAGRAIKLFDLLPQARPQLVTLKIKDVEVLDVATPKGLAALGLPVNFPFDVPWPPCQEIARTAHSAELSGVAARSAAEVTATTSVGEELALFEHVSPGPLLSRQPFEDWYPDPIAG